MRLTCLGGLAALTCLASPPSLAAVELIDVRTGEHGSTTRIVFDLSEPVAYRAEVSDGVKSTLYVQIDGAEGLNAPPVRPAGLVISEADTGEDWLAFSLAGPAKIEKSFILASDGSHQYARLVIDLAANVGAPATVRAAAETAQLQDSAPTATAIEKDGDDNGDEFNFWRDGLSWTPGDGPVSLSLGGRLHIDAATYDNEITRHEDEIAVRRARAAISARIGDRLRLRVERDFSGESKGWKNVWASYRVSDGLLVRAGNQTVPFSLEAYSSSNTVPFMERSLANALAPDFHTGGVITKYGRHYSATVGYFGDPIGAGSSTNEGRSYVGRLTLAPVNRGVRTIHIGLSAERRNLDDGADIRLRTRPEMKVGALRMIDTRGIDGVDRYTNYGAELGLKFDSAVLQAQYITRKTEAPLAGDPSFNGGYVQLSWALTGERRGYSEASAIFTDISPDRRAGALEIAARYSILDLDDALVEGGKQEDITLGLNWYVSDYARFMLNLIHAEAKPNRNGDGENANILGARLQLDL